MGRTFIWIGIFVGSTVGGLVPLLWGDDMFSVAGMIGSFLGAALGLYGGWKLGQAI